MGTEMLKQVQHDFHILRFHLIINFCHFERSRDLSFRAKVRFVISSEVEKWWTLLPGLDCARPDILKTHDLTSQWRSTLGCSLSFRAKSKFVISSEVEKWWTLLPGLDYARPDIPNPSTCHTESLDLTFQINLIRLWEEWLKKVVRTKPQTLN